MSLKKEREAARKAAEEALQAVQLPQELQALKSHFGDWLEVRVGDSAGPYLTRAVQNYGYPPFLTLAYELRELEESKLIGIKEVFENISCTCNLFKEKTYLNFFVKGQTPSEKKQRNGPDRGRGAQR